MAVIRIVFFAFVWKVLDLLLRTTLVNLLLAHGWRSSVVFLLFTTKLDLLDLLLTSGVIDLIIKSLEAVYIHLRWEFVVIALEVLNVLTRSRFNLRCLLFCGFICTFLIEGVAWAFPICCQELFLHVPFSILWLILSDIIILSSILNKRHLIIVSCWPTLTASNCSRSNDHQLLIQQIHIVSLLWGVAPMTVNRGEWWLILVIEQMWIKQLIICPQDMACICQSIDLRHNTRMSWPSRSIWDWTVSHELVWMIKLSLLLSILVRILSWFIELLYSYWLWNIHLIQFQTVTWTILHIQIIQIELLKFVQVLVLAMLLDDLLITTWGVDHTKSILHLAAQFEIWTPLLEVFHRTLFFKKCKVILAFLAQLSTQLWKSICLL